MISLSRKCIRTAIILGLVIAMTTAVSSVFAESKSDMSLYTSKSKSPALTEACGKLTATVVAVNSKTGTITLKVKPAPGSSNALKSAISKLKIGETASVMAMVDKNGKLADCSMYPLKTNAKYTCLTHPCVCSSKPGKCPKCGADLQPTKPKALADSVGKLH